MKTISRREEQILIAIWNLQESAYLLSIQRHLSQLMGLDWSVGAVHKPLMKLEKAGLIMSSLGGATPKRGGRRKKIYTLTHSGQETLETLKREYEALWAKFPKVELA